jgi:phosphatidylglycerol:prolipoprotein diacylglycerol transferase
MHPLNIGPLTAGQLYSLPMLAAGLYLIWRARREAAVATP